MGLTGPVLTAAFAILAAIGVIQVLAGWLAVVRTIGRPTDGPSASPEPITILKPLHGQEPLLAEALATLCEQDYPAGYQIVCGVGDTTDAAIPVVYALKEKYPDRDI